MFIVCLSAAWNFMQEFGARSQKEMSKSSDKKTWTAKNSLPTYSVLKWFIETNGFTLKVK